MLEAIVKAVVAIVDFFMSIFLIGSYAEKHIASKSMVGESEIDKDIRKWHGRIFMSWWFITILVSAVLSGFGYAIWHSVSK